MSETVNDFKDLQNKMTSTITDIIEMDNLQDFINDLNYWETVEPLLDPTSFIKLSKNASDWKEIAQILLTVQNKIKEGGHGDLFELAALLKKNR